MTRTLLPGAAAVALTALLLAGCTAIGSPESASPSSSSRPSSSRPSSTPTATSTTPPAAPSAPAPASPVDQPGPTGPVTCDSLIDDTYRTKYAAAGWVLTPDFEERAMRDTWEIRDFFVYGGLVCQWGVPNTDAADLYGYSPITPAQAETQQARLASEGFTPTSALGGTVYGKPGNPDFLEYDQYYLFADGAWYFSSRGLDEIARMRDLLDAA